MLRENNYHIIKFLIYITFVIIPLSNSKYFKFPFQIPKLISLEFLIILLFLSVFISIIFRSKFQLNINVIDLSIIFRFILTFGLSFLSVKSDNSIIALNILLLLTIFYFLVRIIFTFKKNYTFQIIFNISKIFFAVAIVEIFIILFNQHSIIFILDNFVHSKKLLFKGTFGNPNWVSGYLVAVFPFLILLVTQSKTKLYRYIYAIGTILILLFIVIAQSRGAWVALFIGVVFYFTPSIQLFVKSKKINKIFILFLFSFILCLSVVGFNKIYKMNVTSANGRIFVWKVTALMIADKPLTGIGYGNYFYNFSDYQERFFKDPANKKYLSHAGVLRQSHNEYLQIFAETGIIGLSIFLIIIFFIFYYGIKLLRKSEKFERKIIRVSLTSAIIILVHSLVDTPLHNVLSIYLLLFFNIAVISHFSVLHLLPTSENILSKSFPLSNLFFKLYYTFNIKNRTKLILVGFAISVILLLVKNTIQKAQAYYFWQKGINYVLVENWNDAINVYKKAEKILPNKGELKFNLGAAYLNIGEPEKAIHYINASLNSFKDKNSFISLGFAYMEIGKFNKAEEAFKELSAKLPNLILPHLLLAKLYFDFDKYSKCELEIGKVLTIKPKFDDNYARKIKEEARKLQKLLNK